MVDGRATYVTSKCNINVNFKFKAVSVVLVSWYTEVLINIVVLNNMENMNLFLLRIILASVILSLVTAKTDKTKENHAATSHDSTSAIDKPHEHSHLKSNLHTPEHVPKTKRNKHLKKSKKSKRDAYGKYWTTKMSRSSNFGYGGYSSNLPLYLVYNRKVGAYYPYYKYPKENSLRRSGTIRRVPNQ